MNKLNKVLFTGLIGLNVTILLFLFISIILTLSNVWFLTLFHLILFFILMTINLTYIVVVAVKLMANKKRINNKIKQKNEFSN